MSSPSIPVACLLCQQSVHLGQYEIHLRQVHGVWRNSQWLVEQTFILEKSFEKSTVGDSRDSQLPKVFVKKGDIADIENASGKDDGSIFVSVRRSIRKRSSSPGRSPVINEKEMRKCLATVTIREPEDMIVDVEKGSTSLIKKKLPDTILKKAKVSAANSLKLFKGDDHDSYSDLELNTKLITDKSETFSDEFADECKTKCYECRKTFLVSYFKFHVKNIHGVSLEEYLEVHGDPESVDLKLATIYYHYCSLCSLKLILIRAEVEKHVVGHHQVSLKTYVTEFMKKKSKDYNKNDILTTEMIIDRDESVCEISSCVEKEDSIDNNIKPRKPFTVAKGFKNQTAKSFSDCYADCCLVECSICDKRMKISKLRVHTSSLHRLSITKYKEQFGSDLTLFRQTFHECKLCGKELQLDKDSIAAHVRGAHKWTVKQYNDAFMSKASLGTCMTRKRKAGRLIKMVKEDQDVSQGQCKWIAVGRGDEKWVDANTFSCNKCNFNCTSFISLKLHIKSVHNTSLNKFSRWISQTNVKYQCQCCNKKVFHDRASITAHVKDHLLTLEQYSSLYEKRRNVKLKKTKGLKSPAHLAESPDLFEQNQDLSTKTSHLREEFFSSSTQNVSKNIAKQEKASIVQFIAEIVDSIIPPVDTCSLTNGSNTISPNHYLVTTEPGTVVQTVDLQLHYSSPSLTPSSDSSTSCLSSLPDIYIYICPFSGCDFQTDMEGMRTGPAANHCLTVHQAGPVQVKKRGFKWKKVSLEMRMEELFAED